MANLDAQGGYMLLFLEKHLNVALKERVHWCINLFLSGVLWYNSEEVQEGRNASHGPTEETNGSILLISWVSLRNTLATTLSISAEILSSIICLLSITLQTWRKERFKKVWLTKTLYILNHGCCLHIFRALQEETVLLHFLLIFPMPEVNLLTRLIDKKEDIFKNKCFASQFISKSLAE